MALNKNELLTLMNIVGRANPASPTAYSFNGENFTFEVLNDTLRKELNELASDYFTYQENKNLIFSVISESIDDVLPKKLEQNYGSFAEVRNVAQGDRILFRRKSRGRQRAKQFITRAGYQGMYEVFKLGGTESFEITTSAMGGAAQVGLEEFLDGRADFNEVYQVVLEGMDELIYKEAAKALTGAINQLPVANRATVAGFDEATMDQLINVASAYGDVTIYCTNEFAVKMIPLEAWKYSDAMKEQLWNKGRLTDYKGHPVVILPQAFEDETNARKIIDPGYCWIIPSGADKPVKIVTEGNSIVMEQDNYDRSREVQIYKKVGVAALLTNDICSYVDTSLAGKMDTWSLTPSGVKNTVTIDGTVTTTTA